MIELEKTYLLKSIPKNLKNAKFKEIIDIYFPKNSIHPKLRLRKNGKRFEITKKEPLDKEDSSIQKEQTILLSQEEFSALSKVNGKKIHKLRYYLDYNSQTAEIDVFKGDLAGLVMADFEFKTEEEKSNFKIPDFCLIDVTQEEFIAGGMLCGKKYEDILPKLNSLKYQKINFK